MSGKKTITIVAALAAGMFVTAMQAQRVLGDVKAEGSRWLAIHLSQVRGASGDVAFLVEGGEWQCCVSPPTGVCVCVEEENKCPPLFFRSLDPDPTRDGMSWKELWEDHDGVVQVHCDPIVPRTAYTVYYCDAPGEKCTLDSDHTIGSADTLCWGDADEEHGTKQPTFNDIAAVVQAFRADCYFDDEEFPCYSADLAGLWYPYCCPDWTSGGQVVDFIDISYVIEAYKSGPRCDDQHANNSNYFKVTRCSDPPCESGRTRGSKGTEGFARGVKAWSGPEPVIYLEVSRHHLEAGGSTDARLMIQGPVEGLKGFQATLGVTGVGEGAGWLEILGGRGEDGYVFDNRFAPDARDPARGRSGAYLADGDPINLGPGEKGLLDTYRITAPRTAAKSTMVLQIEEKGSFLFVDNDIVTVAEGRGAKGVKISVGK